MNLDHIVGINIFFILKNKYKPLYIYLYIVEYFMLYFNVEHFILK